ncbi:hypothetical protein L3X38_012365 [Prunus dulcis]|uniref:Disease resistance protein Roq1-like winged-helix domain-containing protein n=1 Tax=Prunus dulcis TaxID=3755 RepID=A0AAD4WJX9_PRUDU|nr:hypothetical protein L3X38_012365 [Prunus dulcis]
MFEVEELNEYESVELFSLHAFGQLQPIEGYMGILRPAVEHCGGILLAFQILGSSLSGKEVDVWHSALHKLCEIPNVKIQKILRISYDSLQDDHEHNIFLHIAYFFIGKEKFTITILDNLNLRTRIGIQNLVDRCLVKINNEDNKLNMHHLLRDIGRGIVHEESPQDPGMWYKDALNILRKMTIRTTFPLVLCTINTELEPLQSEEVEVAGLTIAELEPYCSTYST